MSPDKAETMYSRSERLMHRLAFAGRAVQMTAADIEETAFKTRFAGANDRDPVLITSLARAGTTMVLELLARHPGLAAHTYRDMPFVLAPVFWERFSGRFRREGTTRERAHGDGVEIGFDSPESFEEVFWKAHWPGHYRDPERIGLWEAADADPEATAFLRRHMAKIVALRRPDARATARYVSKNNTNIARLDLLGRMLPDATIIVVLRDPLEHATSFMRQHANFAARQAADPFVARYMEDIGHYEFGALHRPLGFAGMDAHDPGSPDYWLAYWLAAFAHVAARTDRVLLLSYEALCAAPAPMLAALTDRLGLAPHDQDLSHVRPATPRAPPTGCDPALVARARALHADLAALALTPAKRPA